MEKKVLYGIVAFGLSMLSSCLGDPATSLTLANQAGVVGTEPLKVVYVKGGDIVSSEDFQKANVDDGECILLDYSIDMGLAGITDNGITYKAATIYQNTIKEVPQWPLSNQLTDTVTPVKNEQSLSTVQARSAFIQGKLFLFTEMSDHGPSQVDSFALSYDPAQKLGDQKIYDLYLQMIKIKPDTLPGKSMTVPCAFDLQEFVRNAATTQEGGVEQIKFRINYASGFNKDTTEYTGWKSTDPYTIERQVK